MKTTRGFLPRVGTLRLLLLGALGAGLLLAGCAKKELTFVMVPKGEHPYYEPCWKGFHDAGAKLGVKTEYRAAGTYDLPLQIEILEELVARKVDGIAISALSDEGLVPVIAKATAAGIKVITFDAPAPASAALTYIGTMNEAAGRTAAEALIPLLSARGEVAVLQGGMDAPNLNERFQGFAAFLAANAPEIRIVARVDTRAEIAVAEREIAGLLQKHPRLRAVVGLSAEVCPAAVAVLKRTNKVGDITVAGFDDLPETRAGIRDGIVSFAVVQRPYNMGWLAVQTLNDAVAGKPLPKQIDTGVLVVTSGNVASLGPAPAPVGES